MSRILYLHGLDSMLNQEKSDFLHTFADEVIAPTMNYRMGDGFQRLSGIVEDVAPDIIMGSSMGGLMSYHLGRKYNIPFVVFNPALHYQETQYKDFINIPKYEPYTVDKVLILGKLDTIVPPQRVLANLEDSAIILFVEDLEHQVPIEKFKLLKQGYDLIKKSKG